MDVKLRPVEPAADFGRFAEIVNQWEPIPTRAEQLHNRAAKRPASQIIHNQAAVTSDGYAVGFCEAMHEPWEQPGRFWTEVAVDAAYARQGIGAQLYNDAWRLCSSTP